VMNVDVKRTEDDAQPYYILDSKQIEQSGATNIEDFLKNRLTMDTTFQSQGQAEAQNNVYGTKSSINLRGLGETKTLILIDGRRSIGVSFFGSPTQPDINGIPVSAVERIEVLPLQRERDLWRVRAWRGRQYCPEEELSGRGG